MDGVMQAPGGPTEDPTEGLDSAVVGILDWPLDAPSEREIARQERMKREA
jgi:hypothetical protein